MNRVMFSSASEHWATPPEVYAELDKEFNFNLDPCPLNGSGEKVDWSGRRVYCNPPYGRGIEKWFEQARRAELAVYLIPSRTDTRWWHEYVMKADEIRFLKGRLKFGGAKNSAPFPSCVVIFR
jgi:hypothetical protein